MKSSSSTSHPPQRKGRFSRKTILLIAIPFIWILYENVWQEKSSLNLQDDTSPVLRSDENVEQPPIGVDKLADIAPVRHIYANHSLDGASWEEAIIGREPVLEVLKRAGLMVDLEVLKLLPTWDTVKQLYGEEPVILGMERCAAFRKAHRPAKRYVGIAGQHNCGTNAMVRYFKQNVAIPGNTGGGFLPNVPWHKHGWESLRNKYNFSFPPDHKSVLPVVIVRDPYFWMHSMCESPYLMKWEHSDDHCPNLLNTRNTGNPVRTRWGTYDRQWASLAHVWSEFNLEYEEAKYPRLIIRFEDVLFHTEKVIDQIRECAGAKWKHKDFVHAPSAVKSSKYFTQIKPQSSLLSAVIKYGQDRGMRLRQMTQEEQDYAFEHLDAHLMDLLHYVHPSAGD